jgi:hypothetical protein
VCVCVNRYNVNFSRNCLEDSSCFDGGEAVRHNYLYLVTIE